MRSSRPRRGRRDHAEGARNWDFEGIEWCGGVYSHEWGFAKLLHWLRHNPEKRTSFVTALEHCDMVAATLCGITSVERVQAQRMRDGPQMDVESQVGWACRRKSFWWRWIRCLRGVRAKMGGEYLDQRSYRRTAFAGMG